MTLVRETPSIFRGFSFIRVCDINNTVIQLISLFFTTLSAVPVNMFYKLISNQLFLDSKSTDE